MFYSLSLGKGKRKIEIQQNKRLTIFEGKIKDWLFSYFLTRGLSYFALMTWLFWPSNKRGQFLQSLLIKLFHVRDRHRQRADHTLKNIKRIMLMYIFFVSSPVSSRSQCYFISVEGYKIRPLFYFTVKKKKRNKYIFLLNI